MDERWRGALHELTADGTGRQVPNSEATISRSADAVDIAVRTEGLTPGNAYTLWVMAFNNPAACSGVDAPAGFRCGPSDMGNPEAGFGLAFGGDGGFATAETMEFRARRTGGETDGNELGTAGLVNVADAEIHIRIRDHGPAQPGLEADQVGTLMGGCREESAPNAGSGAHGDYLCRDVQATGI